MGDYMPDLSSLFSSASAGSTAADAAVQSSINTAGATPPMLSAAGPDWQAPGAPGPWVSGYVTPGSSQGLGAAALGMMPGMGDMWKMLNSPIGAALFGKMLEKKPTPPAPPAPTPKAPTPFAQQALQLSGGFQPLQIPGGGGRGGGMGGDPYDQLLMMLMKRGG